MTEIDLRVRCAGGEITALLVMSWELTEIPYWHDIALTLRN
eukprot:COSAG01_NODE_37229_length_506_cov_1.651106_1_plen_40_part_10